MSSAGAHGGKLPTWAILAPVSSKELEQVAARHDVAADWWSVQRGGAEYNALLSYEPGAEYSGEQEIARHLSRVRAGRHYLLHLHPDSPWVAVFESGELVDEPDEAPETVARRLGLSLSGVKDVPPLDEAVIIVGADPAAVAMALDVEPPGPDSPLHLETVPLGGTIAWSSAGSLATLVHTLSRALGATVYHVVRDQKGDDFACWVVDKGEDRGIFAVPPSDDPGEERLTSVLGESTPEAIVRALGIPWS